MRRVPTRNEKVKVGWLFMNGDVESRGIQMNSEVKKVHSFGELRKDPLKIKLPTFGNQRWDLDDVSRCQTDHQ